MRRARLLTTIGVIVLALLVPVLSGAVAYLIAENGNRIEQINDERARNVLNNCRDQNARNRRTKARVPPGASEEGRRLTFSLIDALAPVRDCDLLVVEQVRPH